MKSKIISSFIIGTFVTLYLMVSIISTIHVVEFFRLSNPEWLAITLAIAFEVGAAASLASIIALKKMNKTLIWTLFIVLTGMQAMGNTYYAFVNLGDFSGWSELFDLVDEDVIFQKRVLSILSGAILPIVALGFIKSLVDYLRPDDTDGQDPEPDDKALDKKFPDSKETIDPNTGEVNVYVEKKSGNPSDQIKLDFGDSNNSDSVMDLKNSETDEISTDEHLSSDGFMLSPEHFSSMPQNANGNKGSWVPKRYPENL